MNKQSHVNMPISETMAYGIKRLLDQGEFSTQAEYIRHLIRTDLQCRLEQLEYDKLIRERLAQADQGGPFIKNEDVERYFEAKSRGEEPVRPPTFHL
jgi:Arc/MetJ-type ribon-helix-helix transcriptional regulator